MIDDNALSQQEIDALLSGVGAYDDNGDEYTSEQRGSLIGTDMGQIKTGDLSLLLDTISSILQIQTEHLSNLFHREITYSSVKGKIRDNIQVRAELMGKLIQLRINYTHGLIGENIYILRVDDALRLAEILSKQSNLKLSDVALNALSEGFVQMLTTSNSTLSEQFGRILSVEPPQIELLEDASQITFPPESQVVHLNYALNPEDSLPINIHQLLSVSLTRELVSLVKASALTENSLLGFAQGIGSDLGGDESKALKLLTTIRPVRYLELTQIAADASLKNNISLLLDISMQLTVELGRTKMQIKKILGLGEGSIIELEKLAGEPVDLLVNSKLIAKGEVVVIDENFGVRITEIVSPHQRLDSIIPD